MEPYSGVLGGIVFIGVLIMCAVIGLACLAFWIWMPVHKLTNDGLSGSEKVAWALVIFFVRVVGEITHFFVGRPKARIRSVGAPLSF